MTSPAPQAADVPPQNPEQPVDTLESLAHQVPFVLPIVGGVLMFLLAFIAIYMA